MHMGGRQAKTGILTPILRAREHIEVPADVSFWVTVDMRGTHMMKKGGAKGLPLLPNAP
jgi:hypothetical protein